MNEIAAAKRELREKMKAKRADAARRNPRAGEQLRDQFMQVIGWGTQDCIGLFKSFGDEIDTTPLMQALWAQKVRLALPKVAGRGMPLEFHAYKPGDELQRSAFGVDEPVATAPVVTPSVLVVPLLAFDAEGYRLGYGGGYYDRTLARMRGILAVGVGFAVQQVPSVPREAHDAPLDKIVTEIQIFLR